MQATRYTQRHDYSLEQASILRPGFRLSRAPLDTEGRNGMDTWWIDEPHLLGSRNPTSTDLARLRSDGFGVLVSLLCEEEQTPWYDIAYATALGYVRYNIPVKDFCPPTVEQLEQFVELVNGSPPGTKTIVHCEGGIGRTGTFAAAYWVTKGMTVADAIMYVRKARHGAVETPEQEGILMKFASRIRIRSLDAQQEDRGCTL